MKDIITIGCQIPGNSDRYASFTSRKSILDADIVLITPEIGEYEFLRASDPFFQGKICYGENGSYKLREDMDYWKRSLNNFLMLGNTVFLILDSKRDFFLTQNRTFEGKGRTARENINVVSGNSYMFLPFHVGEVISAEGEHVISCHNPYFTEFDKKFGQQLSYKAYYFSF